MKHIILAAVIPALLALPSQILAHGTGFRVMDSDRAVTAEFYYTDNTPMAYAEVLVFSPSDKEIEYQNGRTDQAGRFAFYPDAPGRWRVKVNDGVGHAVQAVIEAAPPGTAADSPAGGPPAASPGGTPLKTGLGISLLVNIFLGMGALKRFKVNRTD